MHGPASGRRIPRPANKAEINRRKATVDAWRERYGDWCPVCGKRGVKLSADHVYSVGRGGREDGPLRVI